MNPSPPSPFEQDPLPSDGSGNLKWLVLGLSLLGIVVLTGYGIYSQMKTMTSELLSQQSADRSDNSAQGNGFKSSFNDSYMKSFKESFTKSCQTELEAQAPGTPSVFSQTYCRCMAKDVVKLDAVKPSLSMLFKLDQIGDEISAYYDSPAGEKVVDRCIARAERKLAKADNPPQKKMAKKPKKTKKSFNALTGASR